MRSWSMAAMVGLIVGSLGGCPATLQRELEILFAADATQNALMIPQSALYKILGDALFAIIRALDSL